jgi:hypothetical protein
VSLNQPDLDLLADYVGGALDGTPDEDRVGERIRSDAEWARAYTELIAAFGSVSGDLHALGAESEPMPPDVWARLEAALSSPQAPAAAQPPAPVFTAPRDNRPPSRSAARRRRWAAPVLAAVAVLFALSLGLVLTHPFVSYQNDKPSSDSGGAAAPAAGGAPVLQRASGRDYTDETLVLATDFGAVPGAIASPATPQFSQEDSAKTSTKSLQSFASPVPPALTSLTAPDALARCLAAVSAVIPGQVVGVDFAAYRGIPAAIVVVRTPDDARWVGAAGANCGESGAHLLAQKRVG